MYWRGAFGYEPETSQLFYRLATTSHGVLDVGAHVGYYWILAGLAHPSARVYAFEPYPVAFERLLRNLELNQLGNVEPIRLALGSVRASPTSSAGPRTFRWVPPCRGSSWPRTLDRDSFGLAGYR
jgi:tRNA G37 N-methylase Trm5